MIQERLAHSQHGLKAYLTVQKARPRQNQLDPATSRPTMGAMYLQDLNTPAALVDTARMQRNITRMQQRMDALSVAFRPHVKTTKCIAIAQAQIAAGARGITVSTLKEAEQFFAAGITDILYAVGMAAPKLKQAAALITQGCALKIIADSAASAAAIASRRDTAHRSRRQGQVRRHVWGGERSRGTGERRACVCVRV